MPFVTGVRFKDKGKMYYFDLGDIQVNTGDVVLVETVRGVEMGTVVIDKKDIPEDQLILPLKKVLRIATPEDFKTDAQNKEKANSAMETAKTKIQEHGLEMHLVDAEYTFDGSKVIIYFTADGRVDSVN